MIQLYSSFDGTITRKPFWLGLLGLLAVGITISIVTLPLGQMGEWAAFLASLALLYPALALSTKRLRDRGRANLPLWLAIYFAPSVLLNVFQTLEIGFNRITMGDVSVVQPTGIGLILTFAAGILALIALVDLGFLKGKT